MSRTKNRVKKIDNNKQHKAVKGDGWTMIPTISKLAGAKAVTKRARKLVTARLAHAAKINSDIAINGPTVPLKRTDPEYATEYRRYWQELIILYRRRGFSLRKDGKKDQRTTAFRRAYFRVLADARRRYPNGQFATGFKDGSPSIAVRYPVWGMFDGPEKVPECPMAAARLAVVVARRTPH